MELVLCYFKTYCSQSQKLDSNIWSLFNDCKQTKWNSDGGNSLQKEEIIPEEAKGIMKDFILNKDFDTFLLNSITPEPFDQKKFAIDNYILKIFDNWESFKQTLEEQSEAKWKYLNEYKYLLTAFEETKFSYYVAFEFKTIPIEQRMRT